MNFHGMFYPRSQALVGELNVDNASTPADFMCEAYAEATQASPTTAVRWCDSYMSPLLNVLRMYQPPVGAAPLDVPHGGRPTRVPGPDAGPNGQPDTGPTPLQSQLPPPLQLPGFGGLTMPSGGN
jgi:phospholipid/cholesterol/gamma-HCH transport system substrate-binding protein